MDLIVELSDFSIMMAETKVDLLLNTQRIVIPTQEQGDQQLLASEICLIVIFCLTIVFLNTRLIWKKGQGSI